MTEVEFIAKLQEMINPEMLEWLMSCCLRKFHSGGVAPDAYDNDFVLPKICLYVALQELVDQYKPLYKEHLRTAKNLCHF